MAGTELIALALPAASPIVVMVMSVPANRAVKHFALLGAQPRVERSFMRHRSHTRSDHFIQAASNELGDAVLLAPESLVVGL
jgi:hypothetical protein